MSLSTFEFVFVVFGTAYERKVRYKSLEITFFCSEDCLRTRNLNLKESLADVSSPKRYNNCFDMVGPSDV